MDIFLTMVAGVLGLIVGSFLNVVVFRLGTGKGIGGRSQCLSCNRTLSWYELIPVMSFLFQKGKCRGCQTKINWQYPFVELVTGLVFAGIVLQHVHLFLLMLPEIIFWFFIFGLLIAISAYDVRHMIVPHRLVYPFIGISFVAMFFRDTAWDFFMLSNFSFPDVWYFLAGPIIALPFFLVWIFSKGTLFGLGDVKIMVGIGWLLGIWGGVEAIILAFWSACMVMIIPLCMQAFGLFGKRKRSIMKMAIPFAPFLVLGLYLVGIMHISPFPFSLYL